MPDPALPRATYRLQFHRGFTFDDARALLPYLAELGVSHVYASPITKPRKGSDHGYDVVDHNALNPEIGDEAAFDAFVAALKQHGLGLIMDLVPNHMGIGQGANAWWTDVLEWGRASRYADYFDIDWSPAKPDLKGKVLVPFLGDHYGRLLYDGELRLVFEADQGTFAVRYYDHRFPITPSQYSFVLSMALREMWHRDADPRDVAALDTIIGGFRKVRGGSDSRWRHERARKLAETLKRDLALACAKRPSVLEAIGGSVDVLNGRPGEPESFDDLHRLLERQHYRLAYWRVASDEINYRRFFQINDLAGIRTENPQVFEATHEMVLRLVKKGAVQGLRIDHVDGLFDPAEYLNRLQDRIREVRDGEGNFPVYVEKVLALHESLRSDWPVLGTTGYDFLALVGGLFIDPKGERPLENIYRDISGDRHDVETILRRSKRLIMDTELASELQVLANSLGRIARMTPLTRDYTLHELRLALREVAARFPVYRTYVVDGHPRADDRRDIDWAVGEARKHSLLPDRSIFSFVHAALTGDLVKRPRSGYNRRAVTSFASRFQQYTGPVMAKGLEDTTSYRYNRLVALNEVGSDPQRFGTSLAAFHHLNGERQRNWPGAMLTTSTHDTKRGEDARMRLAVLSELADEWGAAVNQWRALNEHALREGEGRRVPSGADEYLLYQTLVGSWPVEFLACGDGDPLPADIARDFRERVEGAMLKAAREAKVTTSWVNPDQEYERGLQAFVRRVLEVDRPNRFLRAFRPFARRVAWFGMLNGLSQQVLKLTVPGVPDIYQGGELWNLSMVDPDNRRPVDFDVRRTMLGAIRNSDPEDLLSHWSCGKLKLTVTALLLRLRRCHANLFAAGDYVSVDVTGIHAAHLCAFGRACKDKALLVAVPRLVAGLTHSEARLPLGERVWGDTALVLPEPLWERRWHDAFTGQEMSPDEVPYTAALFGSFPVAVLVSED